MTDVPKRKPGRPSQGPRTSTAVRLKPELHEALVAAAAERDVSVNWLVNRAAEDFLARLIPVSEMRLTRDSYPKATDASRTDNVECQIMQVGNGGAFRRPAPENVETSSE